MLAVLGYALPVVPASAEFVNNPAQLPAPRKGAGAAVGADGKIYVAGGARGTSASPQILAEVLAYDPATNTWADRTPMHVARQNLALVAAPNGKLYAIGGRTSYSWQGGGQVAAVEEFDPKANSWTTRTSMPTARGQLGAALAPSGRIVVFGGATSENNPTNLVEAYDPISDTWVTLNPMPSARHDHAIVGVGGRILAIGGLGAGNQYVWPVDAYDPVADSWSSVGRLQQARVWSGAAATSNGKVYVLGGWPHTPQWNVDTNLEFDLTNGSWVSRAVMPGPLYTAGVVTLNDDRIFAIGGIIGAGLDASSSVEVYVPATDSWLPDLTAPQVQTLGIQGGASATNALSVTLNIQASDVGAGISEMRFSNTSSGIDSADWEPFAATKAWTLSDGGDGERTVYVQVNDGVGNVSPTSSDTIVYETASPTMTSLTVNGGALATTSTAVTLALQAADTGGSNLSQMSFSNDGGATWSAWEAFAATKSWTLTSGDGAKTVHVRARDAAGNISNALSDTITLDTIVGTSYGVSIDEAAVWTNTPAVNLTISAPPGTALMLLSNDGGFVGAAWEPFTTQKPWTLNRFGAPVTMHVYVRFANGPGQEVFGAARSDDIVLDVTPPSGSVTVGGAADAANSAQTNGTAGAQGVVRTVQLAASDTQSGAGMRMRLSNRADFAGAIWKPFAGSVSWDFTGGSTVYAQFRDGAGNVSQTYSQSLPGGPGPGTSGTPICTPRPRVNVGLQSVNGTLVATLSTTGANNGLRAVRFDSFTTAIVDAGDQVNQTGPFAVSIPAGQEPTSLQFTIRRAPGAQSATVRLVVIDGCGEWSTVLGGGPRAWEP